MNRFSTLTKSRLEEDRDRIELVRSTLMRHGTLMVSNDLFELISTTLKNHDAAKDDIIVPMVNDADDPMHSNDNRNRVSATAASTFSSLKPETVQVSAEEDEETAAPPSPSSSSSKNHKTNGQRQQQAPPQARLLPTEEAKLEKILAEVENEVVKHGETLAKQSEENAAILRRYNELVENMDSDDENYIDGPEFVKQQQERLHPEPPEKKPAARRGRPAKRPANGISWNDEELERRHKKKLNPKPRGRKKKDTVQPASAAASSSSSSSSVQGNDTKYSEKQEKEQRLFYNPVIPDDAVHINPLPNVSPSYFPTYCLDDSRAPTIDSTRLTFPVASESRLLPTAHLSKWFWEQRARFAVILPSEVELERQLETCVQQWLDRPDVSILVRGGSVGANRHPVTEHGLVDISLASPVSSAVAIASGGSVMTRKYIQAITGGDGSEQLWSCMPLFENTIAEPLDSPQSLPIFYPPTDPSYRPDMCIETGLVRLQRHGRYLRVATTLPGDVPAEAARPYYLHGNFNHISQWRELCDEYDVLCEVNTGPQKSLASMRCYLDASWGDRFFEFLNKVNDEDWHDRAEEETHRVRWVSCVLSRVMALSFPSVQDVFPNGMPWKSPPLGLPASELVLFDYLFREHLSVRLALHVRAQLQKNFFASPIVGIDTTAAAAATSPLHALLRDYVAIRYYRLRRVRGLVSAFSDYIFNAGLWNVVYRPFQVQPNLCQLTDSIHPIEREYALRQQHRKYTANTGFESIIQLPLFRAHAFLRTKIDGVISTVVVNRVFYNRAMHFVWCSSDPPPPLSLKYRSESEKLSLISERADEYRCAPPEALDGDGPERSDRVLYALVYQRALHTLLLARHPASTAGGCCEQVIDALPESIVLTRPSDLAQLTPVFAMSAENGPLSYGNKFIARPEPTNVHGKDRLLVDTAAATAAPGAKPLVVFVTFSPARFAFAYREYVEKRLLNMTESSSSNNYLHSVGIARYHLWSMHPGPMLRRACVLDDAGGASGRSVAIALLIERCFIYQETSTSNNVSVADAIRIILAMRNEMSNGKAFTSLRAAVFSTLLPLPKNNVVCLALRQNPNPLRTWMQQQRYQTLQEVLQQQEEEEEEDAATTKTQSDLTSKKAKKDKRVKNKSFQN